MHRYIVIASAIGILLFCSECGIAVGTVSLWSLYVGPNPVSNASVHGTMIGIGPPPAADGYDGQPVWPGSFSLPVIALLLYRANDPLTWTGPTGFYTEDRELTPIPPGGSKTWSDFYLWSANWSPGSSDQVLVHTYVDNYTLPPPGYRGHLVIDQVAAGADWTGRPMDYWFDMNQAFEFYLPIAQVSDPTDPTAPLREGTRFHLTVTAPVPEPSSVAALAFGLVPLGLAAVRRRRRS